MREKREEEEGGGIGNDAIVEKGVSEMNDI